MRAVEGDDVEPCLTAARALVARDARVTIPRLVTHLEERFANAARIRADRRGMLNPTNL